MANSLEKEPLILSQIVRLALHSYTCRTLERVFNATTFSTSQLEVLVAHLQKGAIEEGIANGYDGALSIQLTRLEELNGVIEEATGISRRALLYPLTLGLRWSGLIARERLCFLNKMGAYLDSTEEPFPERLERAKAVDAKYDQKEHRYLIVGQLPVPRLSSRVEREADEIAEIRVARTMVAVERYRAANDLSLPSSLAELVPTYLSEVPADPYTGEPLRYHAHRNRYTIYSVGENRRDDGEKEEISVTVERE